MILIPKLRFSLPALTLTEKQCQKIQSPATCAGLPKLHVNRNTARSIVFGPLQYGGIALPHLYTIQRYQLNLFIGHLRKDDKTGQLIKISMSYIQLLVGSSISFLHLPFPKYTKWIESCWLTAIWQVLHRVKIKLTAKNQWLPMLQRAQDTMLMDYFISLKYTHTDLDLLNKCRVYLQVLTLADITSADGRKIVPHFKQA
jgi:hypothetical protein